MSIISVISAQKQSFRLNCKTTKDDVDLYRCGSTGILNNSPPNITLPSRTTLRDIRRILLSASGTNNKNSLKDLLNLEPFEIFENLETIEIETHTLSSMALTNSMANLTVLKIYGNKLKTFTTSELTEEMKMETLIVSNNKISTLDKGLFDKMPNLNTLNFNHNNIKSFDSEILKPSTMLQTLDLSFNQIKKLDITFWQSISSSVEVIRLNENEIGEFPSGAFKKLTKLEKLNLSKNKLKSFVTADLKLMAPTVEIFLVDNEISKIGFNGLKNLKSLTLDMNMITKLEEKLFAKDITFDLLSFGDNKMNQIEKSFMKRQKVMKTFQYSKNPCVIPGPTANKNQMMENMENCFNNFKS
jgi:Leucine-rich repeat (LRR) protein